MPIPGHETTSDPCAPTPIVSFVIASFNSRAFLADAVASALAQAGVASEVIIVDDHSSDDSFTIASQLAEQDPRVRVLQTPVNLGPGGARNLGIEHARGEWLSVLDSDDLLHPSRSAKLVSEALTSGADMIADDLLQFDDARLGEPSLFLADGRKRAPRWIDLASYFDETRMYGRRPNLGFLKPVIRLSALRNAQVRYDEALRIGEDDAFVIALLRGGLRYRLLPEPLYFYRKHGSSISHRLSGGDADRMLQASERLMADMAHTNSVTPALVRRHVSIRAAWAFARLIDAIKGRDLSRAVTIGLRNPRVLPLLRMPVAGAIRKILKRAKSERTAPVRDPNAVLFISRQRLVGASNGSSAYLIALAASARRAGLVPHLLQPSVKIFGRTPFFRLMEEMGVFETIRVRKGIRFGSWLIAADWRIFLAGFWAIASRRMRTARFSHHIFRDRKLASSISLSWAPEELLYVASAGRLGPGTAVADYMFQNHALPYLLNPRMRTATIMHDLFHSRSGQFGENKDSVASITCEQELAMLASADAIVAIQPEEEAFVARHIVGRDVILAQMPIDRQPLTQVGAGNRLLFVGSDTAPNTIGLRWLFDEVWPLIWASRQDIRLDIVGTVSRGFSKSPEGVSFVGLVPDLSKWYAEAGIVISPLQQGSGLKIKLVEALGHAKACVVTETTLQGVDDVVRNAVICADDAPAFAQAILRLAADEEERADLASKASAAARQFEPDVCMAAFTQWLRASAV